MFRRSIVGPIFFETTIDREVHNDIIINSISKMEEEERHCWLQQNGATCHIAREAMDLLKEHSGNRLIYKGLWPSRSQNLSPTDIFSGAI